MARKGIARINVITVVPPKELSFQIVLKPTNDGGERHYFLCATSAHEARHIVAEMATHVEGRIVSHYELITKLLKNNFQ